MNIISKIKNNNFLTSSFWVFLGTGFLNFGNYFYHLIMGKMLTVTAYGALESLISLLYLLFVPTLALSLVIVKFVSTYEGKSQDSSVNKLYNYSLVKLVIFGGAFSILIILATPLISNFLSISDPRLVIGLALVFFANLIYILNKSVIQGAVMFFKFGLLSFIETAGKLGFGILLVYLGFSTSGAFLAVGIGILVALLVSYVYIKQFVKIKFDLKADFEKKAELLKFAIPAFVTTLALTSIYTSDIILVRHFFPGAASGFYSALAVLGKVVFFAASPVILVVFPLASEYYAKGGNYQKYLIQGLIVTIIICFGITGIYFLFPDFIISSLFNPKYFVIAPLLGLFGLFISIYTICALFANFYLSVHKTSSSYIVLAAAILQIILISLFHASLQQVILVSTVTCLVLLIFLLLYYPHAKKRA